MPSFKPFSVTGRHSYSLFDIRLDSPFVVFRGGEHESAGQLLQGTVVLCLPASLRIEDVRLRLIGTIRMSTPGVSGQKPDKLATILEHRWDPFVSGHGKSMTLPAGNYEYPFSYMLPGDTVESVEGIPEASITYRLKATVGRGKLAYDLHSYKHLRVIRTLEPGALEYLHAMSVENIWPNKVDYSITIPQKAAVFGSSVDLEMRFSPLLKGLELGDITARMVENRECVITSANGLPLRENKYEREVSMWKFEVQSADHWQDMIEDTGQEGWALTKKLDLPRKLRQCIQDLNHNGIKVRHKIKLTVALKNPDGHVSELRATLPISIFISPNMPLDEQGNLVEQAPGTASEARESATAAPPGYGEHVLDQLYDDVEHTGFQTPAIQSGLNSPFYSQSRAGSSENLSQMSHSNPITPAALSSRLASVSLDPSQREASYNSLNSLSSLAHSGVRSPTTAPRSEPASTALTRSNSEEEAANHSSGRSSPEIMEIDSADLVDLSRVPSYATAVRAPARTPVNSLPDYFAALSAPRTPPAGLDEHHSDPLATISEETAMDGRGRARGSSVARHSESPPNHRRLQFLRARDQAV